MCWLRVLPGLNVLVCILGCDFELVVGPIIDVVDLPIGRRLPLFASDWLWVYEMLIWDCYVLFEIIIFISPLKLTLLLL